MKKHFCILAGTVYLFSITCRAQGNYDFANIKKNEVSMKSPESQFVVTEEIIDESEPVFRSGLLGVRFMPTISSIKVQNSDGNSVDGSAVISYGYGGVLGFNINKHMGIQAEVLYNTLSQKYQDHTFDRQVNINYVKIPVLFSLNTNRINVVNANFVVGPQWGINVGSKIETTGTGNGNANTQAVLAVKKNDFSIAYGAGLDFSINSARTIRVDFGLRGALGLTDISDRTEPIDANSYYILREKTVQSYSGYVGLLFLL